MQRGLSICMMQAEKKKKPGENLHISTIVISNNLDSVDPTRFSSGAIWARKSARKWPTQCSKICNKKSIYLLEFWL